MYIKKSLSISIISCLLFICNLSYSFESNNYEFIESDKAFVLDFIDKKNDTFQAKFKIANGYYLYKERLKIYPVENSIKHIRVVDLIYPKSKTKVDAHFGRSEIYDQDTEINFRIEKLLPAALAETVEITYQGCSSKGLCYPPVTKQFSVSQSVGSPLTKTIENKTDNTSTEAILQSQNLGLIILSFFGFGLLLSLTPCVFPMIPILSGIIVGQAQASKFHSFNLSLSYTLGMSLTYTLAGILAALSGNLIGEALQNAWVLGFSALVFVVLALSMFGLYELKLSDHFTSGLLGNLNKIKGGKFLGTFMMGALSALVVSPCVAAPLAGALIYISQTHNILTGGLALFSLSLGMGVPLLLLGLSAGALLPRAGNWMIVIRNIFGVLMLGVAIWLIAPVVPATIIMILWAALCIVSSMYMKPFDSEGPAASQWKIFSRGIGLLLFSYGLILLVGGFMGNKSLIEPLRNLTTENQLQNSTQKYVPSSQLQFKRIHNLEELESDLKVAKAEGKDVMLDFYADWCSSCKELENTTFNNPEVLDKMKNFVLLQVDVTKYTQQDKNVLKKFDLFGPPAIIFFSKNNNSVIGKVIGYKNTEEFIQYVNTLKI